MVGTVLECRSYGFASCGSCGVQACESLMSIGKSIVKLSEGFQHIEVGAEYTEAADTCTSHADSG